MSLADELDRLRQMHSVGDLTYDEYLQAKATVLAGGHSDPAPPPVGTEPVIDFGEAFEPEQPAPQQPYDSPNPYVQPGPAAGGDVGYGPVEPQKSSLGNLMGAREWALCLHLSQFLGFMFPFLGFIAPIVIWQVLKDDHPELDGHGRAAVNWIISEVIYLVLCGLLVFIAIGVPLLLIVAVLGIVFPVIAAIKANGGEQWDYPLSIRFF